MNKKKSNKDNNEMLKLIKIVLIITVIMAIFYVITLIIINNTETREKKASEISEIQYDEIIIGTMLKQNSNKYYVLIEDQDDKMLTYYDSLITIINAKEDSVKIYKSDLSSSYNKTYKSNKAKFDVKDISELRVKNTTLFKIEDGNIKETYDSKEKIKKELSELI